MNKEILAITADIEAIRDRVRNCIEETKKYETEHYDAAVWARVDLGHADRRLNDAQHMLNRLIVNGRKPWDAQ